jgi:hypothetical protein
MALGSEFTNKWLAWVLVEVANIDFSNFIGNKLGEWNPGFRGINRNHSAKLTRNALK